MQHNTSAVLAVGAVGEAAGKFLRQLRCAEPLDCADAIRACMALPQASENVNAAMALACKPGRYRCMPVG